MRMLRGVAVVIAGSLALSLAGCTRIPGAEPTPALPSLEFPTPKPTPSGSPTPRTEDAILEQSRNAVVRIEGVDCNRAYRTGSGFFVQPGFVVTAYHVVRDQQTIAVRTLQSRGGTDHVFGATVVGQNPTADVALLQITDDGRPDVLTLADADPPLTTEVASVGYPRGMPIGLETGRITGVDQDAVVTEGEDRRPLTGVIRFSAADGAGTSGGPLLDQTATVVGLVDTGYGGDGSQVHYAVPGRTVKALAAGWAASPETHSPSPCESPSPSGPDAVEIKSTHPDAPGVATAVSAYVGGINAGDQVVDQKSGQTGFEQAYQQLSGARLTAYPTLDKFASSHHQRISNVVLQSVTYVDDTTDTARVAYDYVTFNAAGGQSACHRRSMEYTMSIATGVWTFADEKVRKRVLC